MFFEAERCRCRLTKKVRDLGSLTKPAELAPITGRVTVLTGQHAWRDIEKRRERHKFLLGAYCQQLPVITLRQQH